MVTDPQVIPYLLYEDAGSAMNWLAATFGFTVRARHTRQDGTVRHGEMELGHGGVVMLGSPGAGYQGPGKLGGVTALVRVTVGDLAAHRERTLAAGAGAGEVREGPPGWHSYSVADPEGHEWYFTAPTGQA